MHAKLVSVMTGAALLASIGVANARELVSLTDTQLDAVTAGRVTQNLANIAVEAAIVAQSHAFIENAVIVQIVNQINVNVCISCR